MLTNLQKMKNTLTSAINEKNVQSFYSDLIISTKISAIQKKKTLKKYQLFKFICDIYIGMQNVNKGTVHGIPPHLGT